MVEKYYLFALLIQRKTFSLNNMIKKIYIAGPLFNVHEKKYLEEIAEVLEGADFDCFLPHRDQKGIDPEELKNNDCLLYTSPSPRD